MAAAKGKSVHPAVPMHPLEWCAADPRPQIHRSWYLEHLKAPCMRCLTPLTPDGGASIFDRANKALAVAERADMVAKGSGILAFVKVVPNGRAGLVTPADEQALSCMPRSCSKRAVRRLQGMP